MFCNTTFALNFDKVVTFLYWSQRERISSNNEHLVDYHTLYRGSKAQTLTMRRFASKWASETIGTGKNLKRWNIRYEGYCPYCTSPDETTTHILQCEDTDALLGWEEVIKDLLQYMHKIGTCMKLIRATKYELLAWRYNTALPTLDTYPTMLQKLILQQRRLGWKLFLEGVFTTSWRQYMDKYFYQQKSMKTGAQWSARLYVKVWKCIFALWEKRNKQLHDTKRIADMEGMEMLKTAITKEYATGIGRLPASDFTHLFRKKLKDLLSKSDEVLKNWFLIIRQGRILMDKDNLIQDDFQSNKALAAWIGLSFRVTDEEGIEPLQEAIRKERQLGQSGLPQWFHSLFDKSSDDLLKQNLHQQRLWLTNVDPHWHTKHL